MDTQLILAKIKQFPIAVGAVAVALVFGVILFLRSSAVPEAETERDRLSSQVQTMSRNVQQSKDLPEHAEQITEYAENLQSRLMDASNRPTNFRYFYELAERSGVQIDQLNQREIEIKPNAPPEDRPNLKLFAPIQYTVVATGDFPSILSFLYEIRNGTYFTRTDAFSVAAGQDDLPGILEVSLTMDVLGKKEDTKPAAPAR